MSNNNDSQFAIRQIIKGVAYLIDEAQEKTTKIYSGVVVSSKGGNKWSVQYNGEVHDVVAYKVTPKIGEVVKVFIPQNNQNLAFFM